MRKETKIGLLFKIIHHYITFFLLSAFLITSCMMLFVSMMSRSLEIVFTDEHLANAAKLTFINVVLLSLLFTILDILRRRFLVSRPIRKITDAAGKMIQGDFSVRISPTRGVFGEDAFDPIIECFNKMAEELSGTETLRTDFIANVSHELKTPLAIMQNYATMLQQPDLSEQKKQEYAKAIADASHRLAQLITNILKLNKLENQQIFPSSERYDLGEQLCEVLLQFEGEWEKKDIVIETDIADGVEICADGELLSLVWNNLLSNAFKFTGQAGTVGITLAEDDRNVMVRVRDTGCGMPPEVGAHIFEKFYQGDTSHAMQGNGLGLALVKRVVDILQGEISVESVVGEGSTFTVRIPKA